MLGYLQSWLRRSWLLAPSMMTGQSLVSCCLHATCCVSLQAWVQPCQGMQAEHMVRHAGLSTASSDQVARFYNFWQHFVSDRSFAWADKWNLATAPNRLVGYGLKPCWPSCSLGVSALCGQAHDWAY